jgi:hypothetical protein
MPKRFVNLKESEISKMKSITSCKDYDADVIVENFIDINEINEEGEEKV